MNKKNWLLSIFTAVSLVVFVGFCLMACATVGDMFYVPATMPEEHGSLTVKNGYNFRAIAVEGISDSSYYWSWGNIPGTSFSNIPAQSSTTVGHRITWTDTKNGEKKQVEKQLLPFGDYNIIVYYHDVEPISYRVSIRNSNNSLQVR